MYRVCIIYMHIDIRTCIHTLPPRQSCTERGIHESSVSKELRRIGAVLEEISPPGTYRNVASRTGINLLTVDGIRPTLLLLSDVRIRCSGVST